MNLIGKGFYNFSDRRHARGARRDRRDAKGTDAAGATGLTVGFIGIAATIRLHSHALTHRGNLKGKRCCRRGMVAHRNMGMT